MTNQELVDAAIAIAVEAEGIQPESIFQYPDHLSPNRMRLRTLRRRYQDLCEQIEERGPACEELMRKTEAAAFGSSP